MYKEINDEEIIHKAPDPDNERKDIIFEKKEASLRTDDSSNKCGFKK